MNNIYAPPPDRPEIYCTPTQSDTSGVVQKSLSTWEKIYNIGAFRKLALLIVIALIWQLYALNLHNTLIFPTFTQTMTAFFDGIVSGGLLLKAWTSIRVLLVGYAAGIALATLLTVLAVSTPVK